MITVFTPSFNRAYILPVLFHSLCQQTNKDFEWLIVDDGSTDDTKQVVDTFIDSNLVNIRYVYQENQGKHIAINTGVQHAKGSLFFIVDSDDHLHDRAIELYKKNYDEIKDIDEYCGVSGVRCTKHGMKIGGEVSWNRLDSSPDDLRYIHNVKGDMAEAWKVSVLKQFPFPIIKNERFCSEVLVWSRISDKYIMRYFSDKLYVCNYLDDGLSFSTVKNRSLAPNYSLLVYLEMATKKRIPILKRLKAIVNAYRFGLYDPSGVSKIINKLGVYSLLFFPIGYILKYRQDKEFK